MENKSVVVLDHDCYKITVFDIMCQKNELEKKGSLSLSMAACFSEATEMLRSDPNAFRESQLVLQAEGESVAIKTKEIDRIHVLWYDRHKQAVQYDKQPSSSGYW